MAKPSIICGLDVGTQNIKILTVNKETEQLTALGCQEASSFGVRRGVVINPGGLSQILRENFLKINQEIKKIDSLYLNIGGAHLFSMPSHGTIAVSRADQRISEEDVSRVLAAAQTFSLPSNKEIFDVIPREFVVDGEKGVKEPVGLRGVRLEAEVLALGGFSPYLKNLTDAVLDSGMQILDRIPSAVAAARACLTEKQKELGVAILDIGAGTSDLAVFEEGDLIHLAVLPIGSANITNDIAIGLKTDIDIAEKIKIEFGSCFSRGGAKKEKIKLEDRETLIFSQKELANIVGARISEIFREINKELKKISKDKFLPAGIVLTGGGANLPGMVEFAKKEFRLPVKLGKPRGITDLESDPGLSAVCGLILSGQDLEEDPGKTSFSAGGIGTKLKKFFKTFIP